jgi:hypothetical protein
VVTKPLSLLESSFIEASDQDRRGSVRLKLNCPLRLSRPGSALFVVTWAIDVSCDGFSCRSAIPFVQGELLDYDLTVAEPGSSPLGPLILQGRAEVAWVRQLDDFGFLVACHLQSYTTKKDFRTTDDSL